MASIKARRKKKNHADIQSEITNNNIHLKRKNNVGFEADL